MTGPSDLPADNPLATLLKNHVANLETKAKERDRMADALWEIKSAMDSLAYAAPELRPLHEVRIHRAIRDGLGMEDEA